MEERGEGKFGFGLLNRRPVMSGKVHEVAAGQESFFLGVRWFVPGEEKDASGRGDREHLG